MDVAGRYGINTCDNAYRIPSRRVGRNGCVRGNFRWVGNDIAYVVSPAPRYSYQELYKAKKKELRQQHGLE